jgi:hypothetical protein
MTTDNEFDINELSAIRDKIETMTKFNQVEVLRILNKRQSVTLNENKYGIHINLTDLSTEIINELKIYINYVNAQEINLNNIEQQKENFKSIYFAKDNKDIYAKNNKHAVTA